MRLAVLRVTPLATEGAGGTTIKEGALKEERPGKQEQSPENPKFFSELDPGGGLRLAGGRQDRKPALLMGLK